MFNMENLCLRPYGSCGCGETDVKPKMMMLIVTPLHTVGMQVMYDHNTLDYFTMLPLCV